MILEFGDFELDESLFELRRSGRRIAVQPKVLKLLAHLVRHRDRAVGKEELIRLLWPAESVGETSLTRAIRGARLALGESGEAQRTIRTVRGRGYLFALAARERQQEPPSTASGPGAGEATTRGTSLFPGGSDEVFVGREGLIEILDANLRGAMGGRGRMVLLVGEPGIGKTRLVQEFATRARHMGVEPLFGRSVEGDGAPAYWPWLGIVRQYVERRDRDHVRALMGPGADDIAQALPELSRWLSGLSAPPAISSSQAKFRFYDSTVAFLRRASAEQPLLLIFDDLQRADQPTLRLLQFLARELEDTRLLVVGTYRPVDVTPEGFVGKMLSELAQRDPSRCLQLEGLTRAELARYLEQTMGAPAPPSVVEALHQQTAGNPLFWTQIVSLWRAAGALPTEIERKYGQVSQARGLQEAIQRRLEALSLPCRTALSAAAVIGHEFSLGALAKTLGTRAEDLLELLGEAIRAGVVVVSSTAVGRYRFVHGLLPDALYGRLSALELSRLHQRVGAALETLYGKDVESQLAELAHHFLQGAPVGDVAKAVDYALRAAEKAVAQLAHEEASMHFDGALQAMALQPADEERVMEILARKGEALFATNDHQGSRVAFERSAAIARKIESAEGLARAACGIATPREIGRVDEARVGVLEDALSALPKDHPLFPMLLAFLAKALLYSGEREKRVALVRESVLAARSLRETHPLVWGRVLRLALGTLCEPEHSRERHRFNEELIALALSQQNDELLLAGRLSEIQNSLELGVLGSVDAAISAMTTLADKIRQPYYRMLAEAFAAMRAMIDGRLPEAESRVREAFTLGKRMDPEAAYHLYCLQMNGVLSLQGRLEEQESLVRDISSRYPGLGGWQSVLGYVEARLGMRRQARQRFDRLMASQFAAVRREPFVFGLLCPLAELCSEVGDQDHARKLYELMTPYAGYYGIVSSGFATQAPITRFLGLLAGRMERHELASQHFEAALAMTADGGPRVFVALVSYEYARLLLAAGAPSHRTRAKELQQFALSEGQAMGMARLVKGCQALGGELARAGIRRVVP